MQLWISREIINGLGIDKFKPFGVSEDSYEYRGNSREYPLSLIGKSPATLKNLRDLLTKAVDLKLSKAKTARADLDRWQEARKPDAAGLALWWMVTN